MTVDSTKFNKLSERVRTILLSEWDPIGVREFPNASDEYDGYVALIVKMVMSGKSADDLAEYLLKVEIDNMGLEGDKDRARSVGGMLRSLESYFSG